VIVTRPELHAPLAERLAPRLDGRAGLELVDQTVDRIPSGCRVPEGRSRPLGTGHAVWCCAPLLHGPFAVINADDYYGQHAFGLLAAHFRDSENPAMVAYRLGATLSPHGPVNRGVCSVDGCGHLREVTEYTGIALRDAILTGTAPSGVPTRLPQDAVVSLNFWGLTPALLPDLERGLREFLATATMVDEYFLPHAVAAHLADHAATLAVLQSDDTWLGLTYPGDRPHVVAAIAALHAAGRYPSPVWTHK
jgi:hypothetical protein